MTPKEYGETQVGPKEDLFVELKELLPAQCKLSTPEIDQALEKLAERFGDGVFTLYLSRAFGLTLESEFARSHWKEMIAHHATLSEKIGTEIDFRASCVDYLTRIAEVIANPAIVEAERLEKIERDTITDALTGLFNFRFFQNALKLEVARAQRYGSTCSLIFIDIDHFKELNDYCGHLGGDRALQLVAKSLMASVRSFDIPCRYGGDEFAVITPETPKEGALVLAERMRQSIAKIKMDELEDFASGIGISGGIANYPTDAVDEHGLLNHADHALYLAKARGRKRIEIHHAPRVRQVQTEQFSEGEIVLEVKEAMSVGMLVDLEVLLGNQSTPIRCLARVKEVKSLNDEESKQVNFSIVRMSHSDEGRYKELLTGRS